jgi:putative flavoprotein involved in K+ transport
VDSRTDEAPEAVVIGAGPAGLAAAATLKPAGVPTVVLERAEAIAPAWRTHYERLHLHTVRWLSNLPGYPIPRRHGRWVPRDAVVSYLEDYARHHELDVRLGTEVERIDRDGEGWRLDTSAGELRPRYVVVASGFNNAPRLPDWPGRDGFEGELLHAKSYRNAEPYRGRDVLVVGTGNTGAEIAVDLVERGAGHVRVAVRTPPHILPRAVFGLPGQAVGVLIRRLPAKLADALIRQNQRTFIGDLSEQGLPVPDEGVYTRMLSTGGVPILDIGFAKLVRQGRVEIVGAVEGFDGRDVLLGGGERIRPDAVIAATGYSRGLEPLVGHLGLLDERERPVVHGPYTDRRAPGLHFIGFSDPISGMFREINIDAGKIARAIADDRRGPPKNITHRPGPLGDRALAKLLVRARRRSQVDIKVP